MSATMAIYQIEARNHEVAELIQEWSSTSNDNDGDKESFKILDPKHFGEILPDPINKNDDLISQSLSQAWPMTRLDPVIRSILRAATEEMKNYPDMHGAILINEYMELAREIGHDDKSVKFVNGVLDSISKVLKKGNNLIASANATKSTSERTSEGDALDHVVDGEDID